MKKILILTLISVLLLGLCACSKDTPQPNENTTPPEEVYVIEDMLLEKNLDELKKQYPENTIEENENFSVLVIRDKMGEINGDYRYTVEDNKITSTKFKIFIPYYLDANTIANLGENDPIPDADNTEEYNKIIEELYKILSEQYNFSEMSVRAEHKDNGLAELEKVTTFEEFKNVVAPIFKGTAGEYNSFTLSGFNADSSHFFSINFLDCYLSLEIDVTLMQ